ncbi:MAG TPA: hypothetical protein VGL42_04195 [Opitutaceae bacterium]|jgi:hypothetical protein
MAAGGLVAISAIELVPLALRPPPAITGGLVGPASLLMRAEQGWEPVARQLAARGVHGVVGYWGPVAAENLRGEGPPVERFYQAQFALAPLVLEADGQEDWVVTDERPEERRNHPQRYAVVRDFGGGRQLLRRATSP